MRGTVTQWADLAAYGFVTGEDGREFVLQEDDLPSWARAANARLGMVVEFDAVDIGSRKPSAKNVHIIIGQRAGSEGIT
jgi:cold shock CspA family protein